MILIGLGAGVASYDVGVEAHASCLCAGAVGPGPDSFTVEHPAVERQLLSWPVADPEALSDEAPLTLKLVDAAGRTLVAVDQTFLARSTGNSKINTFRWDHQETSFTPAEAGAVMLQVTSRSGPGQGTHL